MPSPSTTLRRPKVLVVVGSVVLVGCALPLARALAGGDGHWLWLLLLTARRAAATSVAASALALVVVGVVWWVDERRHAARARAATRWLADVGPCTSTWAPRWVTLAGLGSVAVGFVLVFASGGEDWGEAPWGAPEAVAPLVSLVKLVGGVLMLAAPGTLLGGGFWWVSRHQARHAAMVAEHARAGQGDERDDAGPDGRAPGPGPADGSGQPPAVPGRTRAVRTWLTGPARRPTWLGIGGALLVVLCGVVAVVTNVTGGARDFPGAQETTPEDGLLRCCTFVAEGTTLTTWFLVGVLTLWAGLTAVAVAAWWWDTDRQAGRPDTPAWMAGLAPDPSAPVAGAFPPTGAPPERPAPEKDPEPESSAEESTPLGSPYHTARWLTLGGLAASVVGVLLTAGLSTDRVGTTLYVHDAGPALLGLVFLLPVGLALVVSGGLWWSQRRREPGGR